MANIIQLYKYSKESKDGWISVLAHRSEDYKLLECEGWVRKISDVEEPKNQKGAKQNVNGSNDNKQRTETIKPQLFSKGC